MNNPTAKGVIRQKLQNYSGISGRNRVWTRVEQVAMFAANGLGKMYIAQGPRSRSLFFFVFSFGGMMN